MRGTVGLFLFLLIAMPPAAAAPSDPGPRILLHVAGEEGPAFVGVPVRLQYLFLDADDRPLADHPLRLAITLNSQVLYQTAAVKESDGMGHLDLVFPVPGRYLVVAEGQTEDRRVTALIDGEVLEIREPLRSSLRFDAPDEAVQGALVPFVIGVLDEDGAPVRGVEAWVEIRRIDNTPLFMARMHTPKETMSFQYAFENGGLHTVRVVATVPRPHGEGVYLPLVREHQIEVLGGTDLRLWPDMATRTSEDAAEPAPQATATQLVAFDPASAHDRPVGPDTPVRLSAVLLAAGRVQRDVAHQAVLNGPLGTVFASPDLHQRDGVLEVAVLHSAPGTYTWTLDSTDARNHRAVVGYEVATWLPADVAGPRFTSVHRPEEIRSGDTNEFSVFVHDAIGRGAPATQAMVELRDTRGLPVVAQKLALHEAAGAAWRHTFAAPGRHMLLVDPFVTDDAMVMQHYGPDIGRMRAFEVVVQEGDKVFPPLVAPPAPEEKILEGVPAPAAAWSVLGLVLLLHRGRQGRPERPGP